MSEYRIYEKEVRNHLSTSEADNVPDTVWTNLWYSDTSVKTAVNIIKEIFNKEYSSETVRLAKIVASLPTLENTDKNIEQWAVLLAADISRHKD